MKTLLRSTESIGKAALVLGLASLFSRVLGLIRDRILAGQFGAGQELDIYFAAFRIPDLIFQLLVLGAVSAGFIPILAEFFDEKGKLSLEGWIFVNRVLNWIFLIVLTVSALGFVTAPWFIRFLTPGFEAEQMPPLLHLTRILFLSPLFLGLSSVFGSVLQIHKRFLIYSLAPILYNLGIIAGALWLVPIWGLNGLGWGVGIGAFAHLFAQVLASYKIGFHYQAVLSKKDEYMKRIKRLMVPRTLSLSVTQLNLVVITVIASTLGEGSLAVFNFANNLQFVPIGLFGISFAVAAFPTLARYSAEKNQTLFLEGLISTTRKILFYIIPISCLIIVLNDQIVRVLLGTGKFGWQDTILTSESLRVFCLSLFAQSLIPLFSRGFYALNNTRIPFLCALVGFVLNTILAFVLGSKLGVSGLALAFSIASIANFMLLHAALSRRLGGLGEKDLAKFLFKTVGACAGLVLSTQIVKVLIADFLDFSSFQGIFLHGLFSGTVGIWVFMVLAQVFGIPEYRELKKEFTDKIKKITQPVVGQGKLNQGN